jgi:hypothetical protein
MLALGLLIGLAVCIPFFGGGRLFLLDWSIGPTTPIVSINTLGLFGGLTSGVVGSLLTGLLNWALGSVSTWLLFLLFFPTAFLGISRLAGGSLTSRISAGVLYTVNPFVFNRLFVGHIDLLIGYALLPFAVLSALRLHGPLWRYALRVSLWWAALTAITPHFSWIYGVVVLVVAIVAASKDALRDSVVRLAATVASFFVMSMYLLLPHFVTTLATQNGPSSLALYQTSGDPRFGLFGNVAGLYGFWRLGPGPTLPKNLISGWPLLFVAILLVAVTGAWVALRKTRTGSGDDDVETVEENAVRTPISDLLRSEPSPSSEDTTRAFVATSLLIVGVVGYFLALGSQGPTGPLFRWCYVHVPFFAIMREPQKFLMLLALAYAVFFGWGISHLSKLVTSAKASRAATAALLLGIALPLGYTPTMFNGLSAQIAPSHVPSAYQKANDLMGNGPGNVLALPWHLYLSYPFTNNRVVANLTPSLFNRNVISGDNVEAGGVETQSTSLESKYLEELYPRESTLKHFGALVAPLGIKYIVLSKTVDWPAYLWLTHQSDLKMILNTPSLEVWKNLAYDNIGQSHVTLRTVSSLKDAIKEVNDAASSFGLVSPRVAHEAKSRATKSTSTSTTKITSGDNVQMVSPVAFHIDSGSPGWVEIDEPYQVGWSLNGVAALPSAEGTMLVHVGADGGNVVFTPWRSARLGYIISGGAFLLIVLALNMERVRRRVRSRVRAPAP